MANQTNNRQAGADWYSIVQDIESAAIIGCGGIGSWLALFLNKIGLSLTLFDFDKVEAHNIGGQIFGRIGVNQYKSEALFETIQLFGNPNVKVQPFTLSAAEATFNHIPIILSGVDTLQARKEILTELENPAGTWKIYIDGRLRLNEFQIYVVYNNTADIKRYKDILEATVDTPEPCNAQQTSYMAAMIGSYMTNLLLNYYINIKNNADITEKIFKLSFNAENNQLTKELYGPETIITGNIK